MDMIHVPLDNSAPEKKFQNWNGIFKCIDTFDAAVGNLLTESKNGVVGMCWHTACSSSMQPETQAGILTAFLILHKQRTLNRSAHWLWIINMGLKDSFDCVWKPRCEFLHGTNSLQTLTSSKHQMLIITRSTDGTEGTNSFNHVWLALCWTLFNIYLERRRSIDHSVNNHKPNHNGKTTQKQPRAPLIYKVNTENKIPNNKTEIMKESEKGVSSIPHQLGRALNSTRTQQASLCRPAELLSVTGICISVEMSVLHLSCC